MTQSFNILLQTFVRTYCLTSPVCFLVPAGFWKLLPFVASSENQAHDHLDWGHLTAWPQENWINEKILWEERQLFNHMVIVLFPSLFVRREQKDENPIANSHCTICTDWIAEFYYEEWVLMSAVNVYFLFSFFPLSLQLDDRWGGGVAHHLCGAAAIRRCVSQDDF